MAERISLPALVRDEVAPESTGVGISAHDSFCGGRAERQVSNVNILEARQGRFLAQCPKAKPLKSNALGGGVVGIPL